MAEADDDELPDTAALYPADFSYWGQMETATVYDLALLSLGIEPRTIHELYQLHGTEEHERLHLGVREKEFRTRLDAMRNSIQARSLSVVREAALPATSHVKLRQFTQWAIAKGWDLPAELRQGVAEATPREAHAGVQSSTPRDQQKARTQERYAKWQQEADRIWTDHPDWSLSEVARKIQLNEQISGGKDFHTIRKHIRKTA